MRVAGLLREIEQSDVGSAARFVHDDHRNVDELLFSEQPLHEARRRVSARAGRCGDHDFDVPRGLPTCCVTRLCSV
jgi:hypothetical protein